MITVLITFLIAVIGNKISEDGSDQFPDGVQILAGVEGLLEVFVVGILVWSGRAEKDITE